MQRGSLPSGSTRGSTVGSTVRRWLGACALTWTIASASVGLMSSGCIALPAILPPVKIAGGFGAAVGNPLPDDTGAPLTDAAPVAFGRVGITPQAPWPEQHRRPIEAEIGYSFQIFTDSLRQNRNRHGGYVGASLLLGDFWLGANQRARVTVRGWGELFALQDHPGEAIGGGWALGFEIADFAQVEQTSIDGPGLWGYASGELGLGGELFGGVYTVDGQIYGTFGIALTGRLPAAFGALVIPLTGSL